MSKFNAGDIVSVISGRRTYDGTDKLVGLMFEVLRDDGSKMPPLDVTAASKAVKGFEGWDAGDGKKGWYVDEVNLKLVAPAKVEAPQYKVTASRTKRETPLPKSALSPQCKALLGLLEAKGSVTALEASGVYRIRSLSRRITDLKVAGYTIVRDLGYDTTGQRYARYYLKGQRSETVPQDVAA